MMKCKKVKDKISESPKKLLAKIKELEDKLEVHGEIVLDCIRVFNRVVRKRTCV